MAIIHPDFNTIDQLKVPPTEGELYLLQYLTNNLNDQYLIFYEPFLNGSRPDIIILKKGGGAVIIEVKDWNLDCYHINEKNHWYVNTHSSPILSPMQQAFAYKNQLFNLHLPILGLSSIAEPNKYFFGAIHTYTYFHNAHTESLDTLYNLPRYNIQKKLDKLNYKYKEADLTYEEYDKKTKYWSSQKEKINRDRHLAYSRNDLKKLTSTITDKLKSNPLFRDDIFEDFYRRLLPPDFILTQNFSFSFDQQQKNVIESNSGFSKIKGVAGCGKTTILAARAINSFIRLNPNNEFQKNAYLAYNSAPSILILTFNITLCNHIGDKLNEAKKGAKKLFTILNYHSFFDTKANELGIDISYYKEQINDINLSKAQRNSMLSKLYGTNIFKDVPISDKDLYDTILIDEIQDFEPEWIKIIRDNFLKKEGGEMVLFGDQSQNIYERDEMNKRNSPIVQGFGRWIKLNKSYRFSTNSPLIDLFQKFQAQFLMHDYEDNILLNANVSAIQESLDLNNDIIRYTPVIKDNITDRAQFIFDEIKKLINIFKIHPNNLVILASKTDILKKIELLFSNELEETMIMFETENEDLYLQRKYIKALEYPLLHSQFKIKLNNEIQYNTYQLQIEQNRRRKKAFFMQNSGKVKLSTIHSYKGFESKSVFYIMLPDDSPELIYTSITRAKNDLYLFDTANNNYSLFFAQNINNK